jgi:cold shock CspA family protein
VRVLLDEQLPRQLAWQLVGQDVRTVHEQQWAGLTNTELLARAEAAGFEALLTTDHSVGSHQTLTKSGLRIVLVHDLSNTLEDLLPLVPAVLAAIDTGTPGQVVRVPKREFGVVSSFSDRDRRGEIASDETGDLIYVNATQIRGLPALAAGDRVEFTRVKMPEGVYASDVVKLAT